VAPAWVIANAGYDVWMGNNRGTTHSLGHVTYNHKKDREYWDFTWEQMGTFDTPAVIEYIQKVTGAKKITMMGHSEGTTQVMAGAALMPDFYKERLNLAIFLAPPASLHNLSNLPTRLVSEPEIMDVIAEAARSLNFLSWLPKSILTTGTEVAFCSLFDGKVC